MTHHEAALILDAERDLLATIARLGKLIETLDALDVPGAGVAASRLQSSRILCETALWNLNDSIEEVSRNGHGVAQS